MRDEATFAREMLESLLSEWKVSFAQDDLAALVGFTVQEGGYRKVVVRRGLSPPRRLYATMHCLGHVALRHEPKEALELHKPSVVCDPLDRDRLPGRLQLQCQQADKWITAVVHKELASAVSDSTSLFLRGTQLAIAEHRSCRSRWRVRIEESVDIALVRVEMLKPVYRWLRQNAAAQSILAAFYRNIDRLVVEN